MLHFSGGRSFSVSFIESLELALPSAKWPWSLVHRGGLRTCWGSVSVALVLAFVGGFGFLEGAMSFMDIAQFLSDVAVEDAFLRSDLAMLECDWTGRMVYCVANVIRLCFLLRLAKGDQQSFADTEGKECL